MPATTESGPAPDLPPQPATCSLRWDGHAPVSPGWFEMRPAGLPRDTRPLYDEDLDCVLGYQRSFGGRSYVYDLLGEIACIEERDAPDTVPPDTPFVVVGSLWSPGVRSLTRTGFEGIGTDIDGNAIAALRQRFYGLSRLTLRFAPAALADMHDPERFVPIHMLRMAFRLGERSPCRSRSRGIYHYRTPMTRRWLPQLLQVSIREEDCTILAIQFGPPDAPAASRL